MHNNGKEYGVDFMLAGDLASNKRSRDVMCPAIYRNQWEHAVKTFYEITTLKLLREKSYKIGGTNQVDIVRDVGNLAQAHFAAEVCGPPNYQYRDESLLTSLKGLLPASEVREKSSRGLF